MHMQDHAAELKAAMLRKPCNFAMWDKGEREWWTEGGWGFAPIGTHRDADSVTRSNWQVITTDLLKRFPESFDIVHTSHWAVGWYDHLAVNTADEAAVLALTEWLVSLEDYPVADDEHLSALEYAEAADAWAAMSVAERLEAFKRSGTRGASMFAVRRDELPADDNGALLDYLRD